MLAKGAYRKVKKRISAKRVEEKEQLLNSSIINTVSKSGVFNNSIQEAIPMTAVYKLVNDHFSNPSNNKIKKAIIIGYDGCRIEQILELVNADSAIKAIKEQGGFYLSFAGGIKDKNEQETTTGPGWASMLTGVWADKHGVINKDTSKKNADTFLTEQANKGHKSFFGCIWEPLFSTIFRPDVILSIKKRLPLEYYNPAHDSDLFFKTMEYIQKTRTNDCDEYDLLCVDFVAVDKAGHKFGFYDNEKYRNALAKVDSYTKDLLESIKERDSYYKEDWLIIITTDHGGLLNNHGGQSSLERITWLAVNKKIEITKDLTDYERQIL